MQEGKLTKIADKGGKRQDYTFFLFSDLILYASEGMNAKYNACVWIALYTHIYIHTHTYAHTHIHTHTHTGAKAFDLRDRVVKKYQSDSNEIVKIRHQGFTCSLNEEKSMKKHGEDRKARDQMLVFSL